MFVLLHGAWHAAWHWHPVVAELDRRGLRSVAVDLPTDGGAAYSADAAVAALPDDADDIVVVGHSMGGLVAPVVAERLPGRVREIVFVAGLLPLVGRSWDEQVAAAPRGSIILPGLGAGQVRHDDGSGTWVDPDKAIARLCADAPPDLAREAVARLRRQHWGTMRETSPLRAWPDVAYRSIVCTRDAVLSPAWSRQTFRDRFHAEPVDLDSDHSPFLTRPAALADLLTPDPAR